MNMRRLLMILGVFGIGAVLIGGAARLLVASKQASDVVNPIVVEVAPILPEEVVYSKALVDSLARSRPNFTAPDVSLTLVEDNASAVLMSPINSSLVSLVSENKSDPNSLISKLRTTESSFVGVGLEGTAKVNGKTFSWANVNLSNISYG